MYVTVTICFCLPIINNIYEISYIYKLKEQMIWIRRHVSTIDSSQITVSSRRFTITYICCDFGFWNKWERGVLFSWQLLNFFYQLQIRQTSESIRTNVISFFCHILSYTVRVLQFKLYEKPRYKNHKQIHKFSIYYWLQFDFLFKSCVTQSEL